ncbi:MAG: RHS repeat-associated core domain-containing protein [Cyclobacteriaceae bacterium]|nr:RHS repeat-associated core domain-containing protein [Cyclobacteriaceae bacterium]
MRSAGKLMKSTLCSVVLLACCMVMLQGQTPDPVPYRHSSVRSELIKVPGIKSEIDYATLTNEQKNATVKYLDGLGRPVAYISVRASHNQKDIVTLFAYNELGLRDTTFLPSATATTNGSFVSRAQAVNNQKQFYQNPGSKVAADNYPFGVTVYENSPLGQVIEQGAPGADWQTGSNHTIRQTMRTNALNEFRIWRSSLTSPGYYAAGTLLVQETTDENNGKVITVADKSGRLLEKHVQAETSLWLKTLYIYDDAGRPVLILQPEGVHQLGAASTISSSLTEQYGSQFVYDQRGRLVEKKIPGADAIYYAYDPLDRLVLVQDGNIRGTNQWHYIKYDRRHRAIIQGIYTNTTHTTRVAVQQNLLDVLNYTTGDTWYEKKQAGGTHGYSNQSFPASGTDVFTVNYFDDYDLDANGSIDYSYSPQSMEGESQQAKTTGRLTASKVRVLNTANWLTGYMFYNHNGQLIQVRSNNHLSAAVDNLVTLVYNFDGSLKQTKTFHKGASGQTVTTLTRQVYDHAGRISRTYHKVNSQAEVLAVEYEYNSLGQLVDKKLHSTNNGTTFLQSVDYRYTIRGWLRSINNAQLGANADNDDADSYLDDYFGMELLYNTTEQGLNDQAGDKQYYNGNISAIKWKGPGMEPGQQQAQRSYKLKYDMADRLLQAKYQVKAITSWSDELNAQNEHLTYDRNGNIKTVQRNQRKHNLVGVEAYYASETIDDLVYTYASGAGNRLTKVEDYATHTAGFANGSTAATEYTYNPAGSLTADLNKGVSSITYNKLGKVETVNFNDGRKIEYTYNAAGVKLTMKLLLNGNPQLTTQYVGGFVYENDVLKFFGSPEGRVVKNGSNFEYQYALADHQGNTRVVFSSVTPEPDDPDTGFETSTNSNFGNYINRSSMPVMNRTPSGTYSQLLNGGYNSQVGATRSIKVYPGDKVKAEVYAKYWNVTSTTGNLTGFAAALTGAFGVSSSSTGEGAQIFEALDAFGAFIAGGDRPDDDDSPKGFITILLFDKNYNFLDAAWEQLDEDYMQTGIETNHPFDHLMKEVTVKEEGYAFIFVSNENTTQADIHFDDMKVTHTKSNVIQYNEYYPFGMQTSSGWTRDNHNNEYLYNAGSELNASTGWYEMFYRGYDPALGRMLQVDPMAMKYSSLTPYNYSFNDPVYWNDPSGADPTPDQIWNYLLRLFGSMESGQYVRISAEQLHMHITGDSGGGGLGGGYGVDIQSIIAYDAVSHSDGSISLRLYFVSSNTSRADVSNGDNIMGRVMMDYTEIKMQSGPGRIDLFSGAANAYDGIIEWAQYLKNEQAPFAIRTPNDGRSINFYNLNEILSSDFRNHNVRGSDYYNIFSRKYRSGKYNFDVRIPGADGIGETSKYNLFYVTNVTASILNNNTQMTLYFEGRRSPLNGQVTTIMAVTLYGNMNLFNSVGQSIFTENQWKLILSNAR